MTLVFQCKLNSQEAAKAKDDESLMFSLENMMTVTAESIFVRGGKPVACEIIDESTGSVIKAF